MTFQNPLEAVNTFSAIYLPGSLFRAMDLLAGNTKGLCRTPGHLSEGEGGGEQVFNQPRDLVCFSSP